MLGVAPGDANTNYPRRPRRRRPQRPQGSRKYYERAVKADKELVPARRELGVTYVKLGEKEKADAQLAALKAMQDQMRRRLRQGGGDRRRRRRR